MDKEKLKRTMVLEPLPNEAREHYVVRRCRISLIDDANLVEQNELWFQLPESVDCPQFDDCDSYLLAMLMDAMQEGREIVVKGSVSQTLLSNLEEFQAIWNKCLPNVYQRSDITVDNVRHEGTPLKGAVCAFSGGVDATFTVWQHTNNKYGYRTQEIKTCAFVHGFDIPLENVDAFNTTLERGKTTLSNLQLDLLPIQTNYRKLSNVNWEHSHAAALVAALNNLKRHAGTCLIGSGKAYNALVIPWGSSPLSDYLLSSHDFSVIHDGASHNRTEKVKAISDWTFGADNLQVCWEGSLRDRNCGKCEKCLRTIFNFLACGKPIPKCFPESDDLEKILKGIRLRKANIQSEWRQILEYATQNNIDSTWTRALYKVLRRSMLIDTIAPHESIRRNLLAKTANTLKRG